MGCDIHAHLEVKINGEWEHYSDCKIDRWYKLFGIMAGVRGEGPAIVNPKGVPIDMSDITALHYSIMEGDAHTASWFNMKELKELERWARNEDLWLESDILNCYLFGNSIIEVGKVLVNDTRLVFWFDN